MTDIFIKLATLKIRWEPIMTALDIKDSRLSDIIVVYAEYFQQIEAAKMAALPPPKPYVATEWPKDATGGDPKNWLPFNIRILSKLNLDNKAVYIGGYNFDTQMLAILDPTIKEERLAPLIPTIYEINIDDYDYYQFKPSEFECKIIDNITKEINDALEIMDTIYIDFLLNKIQFVIPENSKPYVIVETQYAFDYTEKKLQEFSLDKYFNSLSGKQIKELLKKLESDKLNSASKESIDKWKELLSDELIKSRMRHLKKIQE